MIIHKVLEFELPENVLCFLKRVIQARSTALIAPADAPPTLTHYSSLFFPLPGEKTFLPFSRRIFITILNFSIGLSL
jgi:hypothetical protein